MTNTLLEKIKSRGYWHIVIRPDAFIKERIENLSACQELIQKYQIRHRGWYFPHFNDRDLIRGIDYIEMNTDYMNLQMESWRFYQSGQLAFFCCLQEDWQKESRLTGYSWNIKPGEYLNIIDALYQLAEVYEFTARLAQHGLYDMNVHSKIDLVNVKKRRLFAPGERLLPDNYISNIESLPREKSYSVTDFIARSREYTYEHFAWIMERFGFQPVEHVFKNELDKFFEGRY